MLAGLFGVGFVSLCLMGLTLFLLMMNRWLSIDGFEWSSGFGLFEGPVECFLSNCKVRI